MKITLCGSIKFIDEMSAAKKELEAVSHEVKMPPTEITDEKGVIVSVKEYYSLRKTTTAVDGWIWDKKEELMRNHFDKVIWSDAILVLNYDKNGVPGYVGGNTLLEMGLAFYQRKKIYLLNQIPEAAEKEEILAMKPIVLNGDLSLIK